MEIVEFKSTRVLFNKERNNQKNNTVRIVEANDERFDLLREFSIGKINEMKIIISEADERVPRKFERIIKDVSFWENLVIITWLI